jgi:hypothetical protein
MNRSLTPRWLSAVWMAIRLMGCHGQARFTGYWIRVSAVLLLGGLAPSSAGCGETPAAEANEGGEALELPSIHLEPVFRLKPVEGSQRLITRLEYDFQKLQSELEGMAFRAVRTNEWLPGLVPLFAIEGEDGFELRRLPARGRENESEPLFFALPPEEEPAAVKIAGHWQCVATRGDFKDYFAWELAIESEKVAGRFDQYTEFRYAYLTDGSFRSNRLEVRVQYLQDAYLLEGDWKEGKLSGTWRREDDSERGTWEARRPLLKASFPESVPLYEWRRASDGKRRYALEGETMAPGWDRSPHPLCRVWRARGKES